MDLFGAVGDGIADDTAALQLAFSTAARATGRVDLPQGIFAFKGLSIPVSPSTSGIIIRGAGRERTILRNIANADGLISAPAGSIQQFIQVEDLTIDSTVTGAARTQGSALLISGPGKLGVNLRNVYVKGHLDGIHMTNVSVGRVTGCLAVGNQRDGFVVDGLDPTTTMKYESCYAASNGRRGFFASHAVTLHLDQFTAEGNAADQFYFLNTGQVTLTSPYTEAVPTGFAALVYDAGNQLTVIGPRFDAQTYGVRFVNQGGADSQIFGGAIGGTTSIDAAGAMATVSIVGTRYGTLNDPYSRCVVTGQRP